MSQDLTAFIDEHYERLVRLAYLICRDGGDAADAVQTALEQAWRHRAALRDTARLRPWLDRIVVREATRAGRRRRTWLGRLLAADGALRALEVTAATGALPHEWTALRDAFRQLSTEQRAVVVLHLHAGYTVAETATLVGAPVETVRSRLRLARERLRRELGDVR